MPKTKVETALQQAASEVYAWHARAGALERLVPPWERVEVEERSGGLEVGARTVLVMRKGPLALRWEAVHTGHEAGRLFVDESRRGPFARWRHEHRFEPREAGSVLVDEVDWRLPLGWLGALLGDRFARREVERMLAFRHRRTRLDLERHAEAGGRRMRVAVTGASGSVGQALVAFLRTGGHEVRELVRRAPTGPHEVRWDPGAGELDAAGLEGLDAVVHLAGESIAGGRWTEEKKRRILESRVQGTRLIAETLAGMDGGPRVLVSASAVGIYGDVPEGHVTEEAAAGEGFLAEVCAGWEAAADPAREAGLRVVHPRLGVVLAAGGGALGTMLTPFRAGVGGVVGSGRQWMSCVALEDVVGALHHVLLTETLSGPVNVTGPEPVTNREFTKTLGRVIGRPTILPLPGPAVKLMFGEMGEKLLLEGAAVLPARLEASGFRFAFPTVETMLRHELGREERS